MHGLLSVLNILRTARKPVIDIYSDVDIVDNAQQSMQSQRSVCLSGRRTFGRSTCHAECICDPSTAGDNLRSFFILKLLISISVSRVPSNILYRITFYRRCMHQLHVSMLSAHKEGSQHNFKLLRRPTFEKVWLN